MDRALLSPSVSVTQRFYLFLRNVKRFADIARAAGKTIRLATKSIRVPFLIGEPLHSRHFTKCSMCSLRPRAVCRAERVLQTHADVYHGLMCYRCSSSTPAVRRARIVAPICVCYECCCSAQEAEYWFSRGVQDLLVAYPAAQATDFAAAFRVIQAGTVGCLPSHNTISSCYTVVAHVALSGGQLRLMIDCVDHVDALAEYWLQAVKDMDSNAKKAPFLVCIDVDMAYRPGLGVHLGAHRCG